MILARALFTDPTFSYVFPETGTRLRKLSWWMKNEVRYGLSCGSVYIAHTAADRIVGTAVWLPPEGPFVNLAHMITLGWYQAPIKIGISATQRAARLGNQWTALHEKDVSIKHWYLMDLGVDPDYQKQGIGRQLLEPVFSQADEQGAGCYLETMEQANVTFYEKQGFQVIGDCHILAGTQLPFWTMCRQPK